MPLVLLSTPAAILTWPVVTTDPVVSGSQGVGGTVTSTSGTWTFTTSISYAYQWQSSVDGLTGWADIALASSTSYVIDIAYRSEFIRCNVTATDAHGSASASSNVIGPAPTQASQYTLVANQDFVLQVAPNAHLRLTLIPNPNL